MLPAKIIQHSTLYFFTGISLLGCQSHKPPPVPVVEVPQFPSTQHPMMVKGQSFTIDAPWDNKQNLQQQQDALFTSANEYDADNKSAHKYLKTERATDDTAQYILKSGLQVEALGHKFDTFLQFTIKANCIHIQAKLRCEYKATDGIYSVDLPTSLSVKAEQTPEQMEKNEIATLSKLISHPLKITEAISTPLSLSKLRTKLVKQHFIADSKKSNLYLSRMQYNYDVELSQEKIKKNM